MKNSKTRLIGLSVLMATTLAACGGGGDSPASPSTTTLTTTGGTTTGGTTGGTTAAVTDKYVGLWAVCNVTGASTSEREVITITKTSATQLGVTITMKNHANGTCAGTGTDSLAATLSATVGATKTTTGGQTADRLDMTVNTCTGAECPAPGAVEKWIGTATATQMQIGFDQQLDAQGYPSVFDSTYTKL